VTCGDWDLKSMLPRQCKQCNIPVPTWTTSFINIKRTFDQHLNNRNGDGLFQISTAGNSLGRMLHTIGLNFQGHMHSGLDDTLNIAALLIYLLKDGAVINNPNNNDDVAQMRPGDWLCPLGCGVQYARRHACRDCETPRPESQQQHQSSSSFQNFRPGDWFCSKGCGLQFSRREFCRDCQTPRNASNNFHNNNNNFHNNNFHNNNFHNNNFHNNNFHNNNFHNNFNAPNKRPGDWICPSCGDLQFSYREICRRCNTPSPNPRNGNF